MTVALVLAAETDTGLRGQLAALGVRRVDAAAAADRTGPGLLTVAAAARAAGERVLICAGDGAVPEQILARLLAAGGTAAFTGANALCGALPAGPMPGGALVVATEDLDALASAAESLSSRHAAPDTIGALLGELARSGITVRILDAGPDDEGAVAQLLIDPAACDVARWAAWRELTPTALAGISLGLGLLAAVWFSELAVRAKVLAIAALFASFLAGRTGAVLAASRAGRAGRPRPVADWLAAAAGLLTELAVYAALAASSELASRPDGLTGVFGATLRDTSVATWGGAGTNGVWRLAIAAMGVLGVRRMAALCYGAQPRTPGNLSRHPVLRALEQSVTLPAGERFAVIAVTAVFFGPRLTFGVLLCWGVLGTAYLLAAQIAGSTARPVGDLAAYRGDGVVSRWLGSFPQGKIPPLLPVPVGLLVVGVLTFLGLRNLPGILVLTPVEALLLAAMGSWHPHDGRLDWLTPPLLQAGEYVFLAALGLEFRVPVPVVFALLAAVIVRHADLAHRARAGLPFPADVRGLGWDGRMLLAGVAALAGITPFAYAALSGYLWLLFGWDFLSGWLSVLRNAGHGRRPRLIGMVLAAGAGRRLRPDTDALPKALLPVHGQATILDIALRNLAEVGLRDIVIVVGYAADAIRDRAAALERRHGVRLTLVDNDRAEEWNNAYSLWLAREHFADGALLVNGDTVHPVSVEKTLLSASHAGIILAVDDVKPLAEEEMKVVIDPGGLLTRITKAMDPALAYGEYIGAALIGAPAAAPLAAALEATWRRDPSLYYEDGFQELVDRGGAIAVAPIGEVDWVEVDNHDDLRRARQIAPRC